MSGDLVTKENWFNLTIKTELIEYPSAHIYLIEKIHSSPNLGEHRYYVSCFNTGEAGVLFYSPGLYRVWKDALPKSRLDYVDTD